MTMNSIMNTNPERKTEVGNAQGRRPFDWYAATIAAAITGPFTIWGLYVVSPNYWLMTIGCVIFISFVFWGFGRIHIG